LAEQDIDTAPVRGGKAKLTDPPEGVGKTNQTGKVLYLLEFV
jgi:hypothetical protein